MPLNNKDNEAFGAALTPINVALQCLLLRGRTEPDDVKIKRTAALLQSVLALFTERLYGCVHVAYLEPNSDDKCSRHKHYEREEEHMIVEARLQHLKSQVDFGEDTRSCYRDANVCFRRYTEQVISAVFVGPGLGLQNQEGK